MGERVSPAPVVTIVQGTLLRRISPLYIVIAWLYYYYYFGLSKLVILKFVGFVIICGKRLLLSKGVCGGHKVHKSPRFTGPLYVRRMLCLVYNTGNPRPDCSRMLIREDCLCVTWGALKRQIPLHSLPTASTEELWM